jgi:hypothetical protein
VAGQYADPAEESKIQLTFLPDAIAWFIDEILLAIARKLMPINCEQHCA